jgi:hypothetical protein
MPMADSTKNALPQHGKGGERLLPRRDEPIHVLGGLRVQPEPGDDYFSEIISSGGGDDDHKREDAQQGIRSELEGAVDEIDGVESRVHMVPARVALARPIAALPVLSSARPFSRIEAPERCTGLPGGGRDIFCAALSSQRPNRLCGAQDADRAITWLPGRRHRPYPIFVPGRGARPPGAPVCRRRELPGRRASGR